MYDVIDEKAVQAKDKKAAIGPDVDLSSFTADPVEHTYLDDLTKLPVADKEKIIQTGVDATETGRSGTYLQKDTAVVHSHSMQKGLEVIPMKRALKECDWIKDYL
jgi:hypothetical protein